MYKKSTIHYIAKWVIEIMFYLGIVITLLVPFFIDEALVMFGYAPEKIEVYRITLTLAGCGAVYVLFNIKRMYKTLLDGSPFVDENVAAFRRMAVAAAVICVIFAVQAIPAFTLATVIVAIIFAIGCLFCLTLKDLFKQAINYKNENDLTI